MIEAVAAGARALGVLASAHLIGTCLFLIRSGRAGHPDLNGWFRRLVLSLPAAALLLWLALILALISQAAQIGGGFASTLSLELLGDLARNTYYGKVWTGRLALASMLLALSLIGLTAALARPAWLWAMLATAAMVAAAAPLSGHASGSVDAGLLVPLHMMHIVALSAWLGGLPAWLSLAVLSAGTSSEPVRRYAGQALRRFSSMAMLCMSLIVLSGGVLAWDFIGDEGDLLGTPYGRLLCGKLILLAAVLVIANRVRLHLLPQLEAATSGVPFSRGARQVFPEWALGLCILVLGAWLAQTTPALHDQPSWWLPFRFSFDATWLEPNSRLAMMGGGVLAFCALPSVLLMGRRKTVGAGGAIATGFFLIVGSACVLWGLSAPAYPDTFRRSDVAYLTLSIAQGQAAYEAHCVSCHGPGGLGDGSLAASLPRPPANLSEPHTALHTAGDMYWWFTHGIPESGMPGFGESLAEEQRWDLVNFLRAFSQGFQARVLGSQILPEQPWLGAPNFYYDTNAGDGGRAELKDLRRQQPALLVIPDADDPRSLQRVTALRGLSLAGGQGDFALIMPQAADVWGAYQLLTRTLADRGAADRIGMPRRHAEFLIDRFGYIRARWIPADEPLGWESRFDLRAQLAGLEQEPEILPPPDLHLHN